MIPRLKLLILLFMIEPKWFDIKHIPIRRKCFTVIFGKKKKMHRGYGKSMAVMKHHVLYMKLQTTCHCQLNFTSATPQSTPKLIQGHI